jgi:ribulose-phosphate 3-epimerase
MTTICPTVTAQDITEFNRQQHVAESFAKRIHLDLMDGQLAPTISPDMNSLSLNKGYIYDFHLMYNEPHKYIDQIISLKPNLVIVHAETNTDIPLFATSLRQHNIKTGLAILPETSIESISYLLPHLQHVLVFGGKLGYHGGKADLGQLAKASLLKQSNRHVEIAWDGGANIKNIKLIAEAGVDVINVGSAIQGSDDPKLAFNQMQSLLAELKNVTI